LRKGQKAEPNNPWLQPITFSQIKSSKLFIARK